MNDLDRILSLAGLATEQSVAAPADRELKEYDEEGCPCCGGGRCTCKGDCPDCNCHGNNEWDESIEEAAYHSPRFAFINNDDEIEIWNNIAKRHIRSIPMKNKQSAIQRLKKANYKSSLDTFKGYQMWYMNTAAGVRFSDYDQELEEAYPWGGDEDDENHVGMGAAGKPYPEEDGDTYAMISYDYHDNWGSIELIKDGETVEDWNDYFHSNEDGNQLAAKFVELCKKHGIDPTDIHILSGNDEDIHPIRGRKSGRFDGQTFQWNESVEEAAKPDFRDVDGDGDTEESWKDAEEDKEEMKESKWCGVCGNDVCSCTDTMVESPTMDTTQLVIMMRNAGLSEETITQKLEEWANTPEGVGEVEPTVHGDAYDFAQSVNLSLKRYLDAQDMKVQVTEHKVENMKALYAAHKAKK